MVRLSEQLEAALTEGGIMATWRAPGGSALSARGGKSADDYEQLHVEPEDESSSPERYSRAPRIGNRGEPKASLADQPESQRWYPR